MTRRLKQETGFAVATAIIVMTLMLTLGLATLALVDNQTQQSGRERMRETAYNVAEAALSNEVFTMSQPWPGKASYSLTDCTNSSTGTQCPSPANMAQAFQGSDFSSSTVWNVSVRDNLGSAAAYYRKSVVDTTPCPSPAGAGNSAPCRWDSNGDGLLWVRAQATVAGRTRKLVTLARQQQVPITLPFNAVLAGKLSTTNNGLKPIVDEQGCWVTGVESGQCLSAKPGVVAVRCSLASGTQPSPGDPCLGYDPTKGQLSPDLYYTNFQGIKDGCANGYTNCALTALQQDALRTRAMALGTYYPDTCPTDLSGAIVFVDNPPGGTCSYTGGDWNTSGTPGMLFINHGTLRLDGNITFFGVVYAANANPAPTNAGDIVVLGGTTTIRGPVIVEGPGGVLAGSSKVNIVFDPNAAASLFGYSGSAAISQNSYRELPAGQ